jgi:hypothetical protein
LKSEMPSFRSERDDKVIFKISPDSLCPCGSQRPARRCCLTKDGFVKKPAATSPPSPNTGKSNNRCYASSLADCSSKITLEHYISKSLLKELSSNGYLQVQGFSWQSEGEEKVLPISALGANILCKRHNEALSLLDSIAARFLHAFDEENAFDNDKQRLLLFSGHDMERWLLKVLYGLAFSGNLNIELKRYIPIDWLEILFGYKDFSYGQGLYICGHPGEVFEGSREIKFEPAIEDNRIIGIKFFVCGYELVLFMTGFPERIYQERRVIYRPLELHVIGKAYEKSVIFSWIDKADLGTIHLEIPNRFS